MPGFDGINQPNSNRNFEPVKSKQKKLKWLLFFCLIAIVIAIGFGGFQLLAKTSKIFTGKKSIFTRVSSLFISNDKPLIGEETGMVNVLLLGIGGEGHDGAHLTDTMIVASINVKTYEVVLTSIPRDWFTPITGHGLNKINAVYAYALQDNPKDPNLAGEAVLTAVEKVTGFEIAYYALVDFKGFVEAVDHVGGLDIQVQNTFTDSTFPNDFPYDTKGYLAPVTFTKGTDHMSGQRALIYARSRHSSNSLEASDFARSERQKKILITLKDELLKLNITNLNTLNNLLSDFTNNFRTNFEPHELLRLANLSKQINGDNVYSFSLEPQGNLICAATIDQLTGRPYIRPVVIEPEEESLSPAPTGTSKPTATPKAIPSATPTTTTTTPTTSSQIPMYIVQPCSGKTTADIQKFLSTYWDLARLKKEGATIEVQNSTGNAKATTAWKNLGSQGLTINFGTFTGKVPFGRTILYDNSKGAKPRTLDYLQGYFNFTVADVQYTSSKADFVIILGNDSL